MVYGIVAIQVLSSTSSDPHRGPTSYIVAVYLTSILTSFLAFVPGFESRRALPHSEAIYGDMVSVKICLHLAGGENPCNILSIGRPKHFTRHCKTCQFHLCLRL